METPKEVTIRINVKTNIEESTLHVPRYTELGMEEVQKKAKEIYDRVLLSASQQLCEHVYIHCTKPMTGETRNPEPKTIKAGSVVRLKSGGPKMTVSGIGVSVSCHWFDGMAPCSGKFQIGTLSLVE